MLIGCKGTFILRLRAMDIGMRVGMWIILVSTLFGERREEKSGMIGSESVE